MNLQEWSSFLVQLGTNFLEIQHIFILNIFAVLFLTAVALRFILWLSIENYLCAHVINEQYPLAILDWHCWCFQTCPFFSGGVTAVREKAFSRLSPRESTGAEESVGSTKTQANLWKKKRAGAYFRPNWRSQKYHPNPIHKYTFLSEPFPALAALRMVFL